MDYCVDGVLFRGGAMPDVLVQISAHHYYLINATRACGE